MHFSMKRFGHVRLHRLAAQELLHARGVFDVDADRTGHTVTAASAKTGGEFFFLSFSTAARFRP
jgi:hypothetical protein